MIISDEQVERVLEYMRSGRTEAERASSRAVSDDLSARIHDSLAAIPDVRSDRVEQARMHLDGTGLSAQEVADKMIARVVSDSIR
jgi:hypothetical protein